MQTEIVTLEPVAVRLPTAGRMLDCSVTTIHEMIKAGELETIQIGKDRRVTIESIRKRATPAKARET